MSTKVAAIKQFIEELREDIQGYHQLHRLLDKQYKAMIQRDVRTLTRLSAEHNQLLVQLNARAKQRTEILKLFGLPENALGVSKLINALPKEYANKVRSLWNELQKRVHDSMTLNERNSKLLNMQQNILSEVISPNQTQTYEPI